MTPGEKRKRNALEKIAAERSISIEQAYEVYRQQFRDKGGRGGRTTGETKVRGDREYYSTIGKIGRSKKRKES